MGWLPIASLVVAFGVLAIGVAHRLAEAGTWDAQPLFWVGVLLIAAPPVIRQLSTGPSRDERIALVLLTGLGLFCVKLTASPFAFTFPDEFTHTVNVQNILDSGHLFGFNPLVPVTSFYPGLANVAAALTSLSGLSIFQAGVLISGIARLLLMLATFLLLEQITASPRLAGIAATLYAGNPNYALYSAEFGYETLALPLAIAALLVVVVRARAATRAERIGWTIAGALPVLAVVVTHHVTSYALALALVLTTAIGLVLHRRGRPQACVPWDLAVLACASVAVWFVAVGGSSGSYLANVFGLAAQQGLAALLSGQPARKLFESGGGLGSPLWQQLVGFAWLLAVVVGLVYGFRALRRRALATPLAAVLCIAAAAFLPVQALRLTPASWETANRSSEFLFLGCALVIALAVSSVGRWQSLVIFGATLIVFGGVMIGWPYILQLPPPYLVRAENGKTIDPEDATDAFWALQHLGPDNVVAVDPSNAAFMAAYGKQHTYTGAAYGVQAMLLSPTVDSSVYTILDALHVQYVVVDRRARSWNLSIGFYPTGGAGPIAQPSALLDTAVYSKFDDEPNFDRLADSGYVAIYAVNAANATSAAP